MCHLWPELLEIEATNKAVVVQSTNKPVLAWAERLWNTHVEDHNGWWWYNIEYLTRSSTCQWPTVVECFICHWVGLKERYEGAAGICIGAFEHRYDSNGMKKRLVNDNEPKLFIRTESSSGPFLSRRKRWEIWEIGFLCPCGLVQVDAGVRRMSKRRSPSPTQGVQLGCRQVECDLNNGS